MSGLGHRFRRAISDATSKFNRHRPGTALVRVDRPGPLLPSRSRPPRALSAPEHPFCRRCGTRHEPRPHPAGGGGLAAAYGRVIGGWQDNGRPEPLGRGPAHDKALYRDQVNPWRDGTPDPPPLSLDLAQIREELYAPRTYWPYPWERRDS